MNETERELELYTTEFGLDYCITLACNCKGLLEDHVYAQLDGALKLDLDGPASLVLPVLRTALGVSA